MADEIPAEQLTGRTVLGFYTYTYWPDAHKRRCAEAIQSVLPEGRTVQSLEYLKIKEPAKVIKVVLGGSPVLTFEVNARNKMPWGRETAELLRAFFAAEFP